MTSAPDPYDEQATLNELVFALGGRDEPTVALVECASLAKRQELETEMARRMPEYQFYPLDVTPYTVTSLLGTLQEHLPAEVRDSSPVQWVVNVHGLENSRQLSQEGQLVPSPLTAQLNLERELLFRRVPYLIVLWGDADFFRTVQREAPDFWHWVTYRFRFEDRTARPVAALPPLPPERLPGPGNVAERQARIAELRERYDYLALDDSDKKRLLKDKIDILTLLGAEYKEAFMYREASEAYHIAIALQERMLVSNEAQAELWFELGEVSLMDGKFPEALESYEKCKHLVSDNNMSAVFHQIGRIYQGQKQWDSALYNYQQSIEIEKIFDNKSRIGNTYHQIGMLYTAQLNWPLALLNYQKALEQRQASGDNSMTESTYHQIGIVYHQQTEWELALENYQKSMYWMARTKNEYGTGLTSYLIGRVYTAQQLYPKAITWLRKSVKCFSKYGHPLLSTAKEFLTQTINAQHINTKKQSNIKARTKKKK